jgi:hypothetical protein
MNTDININRIVELVSVSFSMGTHNKDLIDLYKKVYGKQLCYSCRGDRFFAYTQLKRYVEEIQNKK